MKLTKEDTLHTAELAMLSFNEEETEKMQSELGDILEYVELLNEVDTNGVEPLTHILENVNAFRKDETGSTLSIEETLQNAPEKDDRYFKVPKVL